MTKKIIKNNLYLLLFTSIIFAFYSYIANASFYEENSYSNSVNDTDFFANSAVDQITYSKANKVQATSKVNNQIISNTSSNDRTRTLHNTIIIRTNEQNINQNKNDSNFLPVDDNNKNKIIYKDTRAPKRREKSYFFDEWWDEEVHDRGEPYVFVGIGFTSGKHIGENNVSNSDWEKKYNASSTSVARKEVNFSAGLGVKIHNKSKTFFVAPEITYNYFGSFAADTQWYGGYNALQGPSPNENNATVVNPAYTNNRTRWKDMFGVGLRFGVNIWRITPYVRGMVGLSRISANTDISTTSASQKGIKFSDGQIPASGEYDRKDRLQFAWGIGGGVEIHIMRHMYMYLEYMHYVTQFAMRTELNKSNTSDGMKNSLGLGVFSIGLGYWF